MVEKIITFGHVETDKHWIHCYESPEIEKKKNLIAIKPYFLDIDYDYVLVPNKISGWCLFPKANLKMSFWGSNIENVFFEVAILTKNFWKCLF